MPIEKYTNKYNKRNIGIIAHIDAGKTTTTERILYLTGNIHKIGEVHDGNTSTDYLTQERERGITIISACVSCNWKNTQINIIDTPGHIDFAGEVERSLRVLDSAVVVLDAVAGVEPQTETVWSRSEEYEIPKIVYINKMDRESASYEKALFDLSDTFGSNFIPIVFPIGESSEFQGVYNAINKRCLFYDGNLQTNKFSTSELSINDIDTKFKDYIETLLPCFYDAINLTYKNKLDENSAEKDIKDRIRDLVVNGKGIPVLCGSSFKNKGIEFLLDSIVDFFPLPNEKVDIKISDDFFLKRIDEEKKSGLIFKVVTDKFLGNLAIFRVYSGVIKVGDTLKNSSSNKLEKIGRIIRLESDKKYDISEARSGDIVGLVNLKFSKTGDTLCETNQNIILENISFSNPVISASIIPKTKFDYDKLPGVLKKVSTEDQTFHYKIDPETKETIISGLGKLHLDIVVDRMKLEHGVEVTMQKPEVIYKETIKDKVKNVEIKYVKQTGGRGQYAHVVIDMEPSEEEFVFVNKIKGGVISSKYFPSIEKAAKDIIKSGAMYNYPVFGVKLTLINGSEHLVDSSDLAFRIATEKAFKKAFSLCKPYLLEPISKIKITCKNEHTGKIISDLLSKRGEIISTVTKDKKTFLTACVPRANLFEYATELRSISSGTASFGTLDYLEFKELPEHIKKDISRSGGI